jgi:hypothetical protein
MKRLLAPVRELVAGPPEIHTLWVHTELESLFLLDWPSVPRCFECAETVAMPDDVTRPKLVLEWLLRTQGRVPYEDWGRGAERPTRYRPSVDAPRLAEAVHIDRLQNSADWTRLVETLR